MADKVKIILDKNEVANNLIKSVLEVFKFESATEEKEPWYKKSGCFN